MIPRDYALILVGMALAGSIYAWWLFYKVTKKIQPSQASKDILILRTQPRKIGFTLEMDRDVLPIFGAGSQMPPTELNTGPTLITMSLNIKDGNECPQNEVTITDLFENLVEDMKLSQLTFLDLPEEDRLRLTRPIEIVLREAET